MEIVKPGEIKFKPFTVEAGTRYTIDGCNTGINTYVFAADQLATFQSGTEPVSVSQYSPTGDVYSPQSQELKLPLGSYYFGYKNTSSQAQSIVFILDRWVPSKGVSRSHSAGKALHAANAVHDH